MLDEEPIRPCLAIELGCGTGTNAVLLAKRGFRVTAVDRSETALDGGHQMAGSEGRCFSRVHRGRRVWVA